MLKTSAVAFIIAFTLIVAPVASTTPLDDYVNAPDDSFKYEAMPALTEVNATHTVYIYKMTSQNWLTEDKVNKTEWNHWVKVIVPEDRKYDDALLLINGGSNPLGDTPGGGIPLEQVAISTKSILVDLQQVPNQRLKFADEKDERYIEKGRTEDELIAYLWDKFLETEDPMWLPRLPMTKASVRAMDLVQAEYPHVQEFVVAGASKRGWTVWTTAAVDKRVKAIIPAVIDVVNVVPSLDNHIWGYGFWAPATQDYAEMNVLQRNHESAFEALCKVVDPIYYKDRYTMPKMIVNSAGDQFFTPDSSKFYYDQMPDEKFIRYVANADHSLNMQAFLDLAAFHHAIISDTPRPEFTWSIGDDGSINAHCKTTPVSVTLWEANNPEARDFRLESVGRAYKRTKLEVSADGHYTHRAPESNQGWTASFLEFQFANGDFQFPFKFTTGVSIVPDTYPHKP